MSKQAKKTSGDIEAYQKHIRELLRQAEDPEPGNYEIRVAEVLMAQILPEVAIVKDTEGKIWAIPENKNPDMSCENPLVSRWDVRPGMKLRLNVRIVAKEITPEVLTS